MPKRDTQRQKVYDWEHEVLYPRLKEMGYGKPLSLDECAALATQARARYGLDPLAIEDGRSRRRGVARAHHIALPRFARHAGYLYHEVAHTIERRLVPVAVAWHGPEFMRLYLDVLDAMMVGLPMRELRSSLRARRIRVAPTAAVPRPLPVRSVARLDVIDRELEGYQAMIRRLQAERQALREGEPVAAGARIR